MLSSGLDSLLGSSMSAAVEEPRAGLPGSLPAELVVVPEPARGAAAGAATAGPVRRDVEPAAKDTEPVPGDMVPVPGDAVPVPGDTVPASKDMDLAPGDMVPVPRDTDLAPRDTVPVPRDMDLAPRDAVPAKPRRTAGVDTSSPKSGSLGEELKVIAHGLAASCSQEAVKSGGCEEDEETQRDCRKRDCSAGGCQRGDKEGRVAEEGLECCALTAKERLWSKQEELGLNQHGVKFSSIFCTEMAGSLKNKEENQANVQVTAETLPKPAEEAQGMKADGTRMFSKAGFRNDRVSKDLPAESSECPHVDTVVGSDKVPDTSTLVFSESLIVRNVESAIEHPQEKNEYNGLKAPTVMLLATGSNVSILKTREEKLPREIPVDESNTPLAVCQSYQQDEGKTVYDLRTVLLPNNEPDRASIQSSRTVSIAVSEVSCPVQKGTDYLDFRNTLGESSSTAVHRINREGQEENLSGKAESQNHHDHETGVLENQSSKSIPAEQPSVVGNEELSRYKTDHREISDNMDNSYSSGLEDAAEIQTNVAMGDKAGDSICPQAREDVMSECCSSSVFSSTASSPEDFSREKLKIIPSEAGKWKKDQCQLAVIDQHKDDTTGNSLLMETNNIVPPETEQTYVCVYNTSSKNTTSNNHGCLELSSKLQKGPPVLQLMGKESESNITSELAGNLVEAPEANCVHSLSIGKETKLVSSLNIPLSPFAQNSQVPHDNELTPCTANVVSSRDKAQRNLSEEGSIDASRAMEEEVTEFGLPEDKFRPSVNLRTIDTPNLASKASQKNMISLLGTIDSVVTDSENEQSDTWNCNYQRIKDQCTPATTSHILSERTHVGDDLPNSHLFKDEGETKPAESDSLEGEDSLGCDSKEPVISEEHFPSAGGSAPWEDDGDNGSVALHVGNNPSKVSNENMEVESLKQLNLDKDGNEVVCDKDEAQEPITMCALQIDKLDKIKTVNSPDTPETNERNESTEQLLVKYLIKERYVDNFGFCNTSLGSKKRELGTVEEKDVSSLAANLSEYTASICDSSQLLDNMNIQGPHCSQPATTMGPVENEFLASRSELVGPVPGSRQNEAELSDEEVETQHLESLHKHPVLQTSVTSIENTKITTDSSQSEEMLLKSGDNLTPLIDKCVRKDHFHTTIKDNRVDLDSLNHVGNAHFSGYTRFINEEKTNELKESKKAHGREDKGAFEGGFYSKTHCSQHICSISCEKKGELLVFTGNPVQKTLSKPECSVGDQKNTVNVPSLPISTAIHGSLSDKPENMNLFPEMENKPSLRVKPMLENTPQQLLLEPGEETRVDLEAGTATNLGVSLPQKEEQWMSIESTQTEEFDSSSTYIFNAVSSVTKPLYVTMRVKRKGRTRICESPSAEHGKASGLLQDAKSSRVCLQSKAGLTGDGDSELPRKGTDVTLPENNRDDCRQKFKNSCVQDNMEREVSPGKTLPIYSTLDEGVKERINQLSEIIHDCQAEDSSDTKPSLEMQYDATSTFFPCMSMQSSSCKELSPKCVVCREVCVPYSLNAQSKDNKKEIREGQDSIPTHSVWKENETFRSEKLDQIKKCQALKRKKMYTEVEAHLSDKAAQEQRSSNQAKVALQPSALSNLTLLRSSSKELVISRDTKFEGPSKEIFAVTNSENKLRSTLQDVKRPKITTDVTSSQVLKSRGSETENLSLNSEPCIKGVPSTDNLVCAHHLHPETACDEIPGAFGTTNKLRGLPPLKKQPGRACKKVPTSEQPKSVRKGSKIRSSTSKSPSETFHKQENLLLNSLYLAYKPATTETEMATRLEPMPMQRAKRSSLLNTLKFRKCTKEPALLSKLSAVANKLLAPAKSLHDLKSLPRSSEILPVAGRYSQRRAKNLLEAFSCINRNLHSHWADSWCTKMFSVQSLALYPVESTKIPLLGLSHRSPSSPLDTPVFPISFQIKLDSSSVTDLMGIVSRCSVHHRRVWGEAPEQPSGWTFSLLLSQSCSGTTASKEDSSLANELHSSRSLTTPGAAALHPDHGRSAIAERRSYSMLGLQTVLALSSPGCYRIWTRRRTLTSRIPTIQRLFMSQFTQGLKGVRFTTSVADDLFSSLPYSLGRALSIWSQHGPSARPSEITPLHSHQCKWQPSGGIENSCALLPHLPVQRTAALQAAAHEIRYSLGPSFPLPLPKPCSLPESSSSPLRLSAPELQVPAFDEADVSVPACLGSQDDTDLKKIEPEKRPKKVSQIRIRKTVPKPDHNLTPMGLPRPKRLKKKEFSLEEIYTNKNYKSPPPTRSLETIFEEPKVKNGVLISVSQQKRKRVLEFQDFTVPRKRKARSKIKAVGSFTRAKRAALQGAELDALLIRKLMDLEAFFANEAEHEAASSS